MWKVGRKKKTSDDTERLFPSEKEFWLMCGEFRDRYTDRSKRGYYGLCSCSTESVYPPGEKPCQDRFYKLVHCMTESILQTSPSVVLIEDISRSDDWERQKNRLKQLALNNEGLAFEEMGEWKDCYAFVFSEMPNSFLKEVYWWMAEHACKEDIYVQYSVLEKVDVEESSISAIKEKTILNVLMDDTHPVLILQLAPMSSIEQVADVLLSTCNREGWTLSVK